MASNRVFGSALLASGVFLIAGCASQPASTVSLDDKYFEREADNYLVFLDDKGQKLYCQNVKYTTSYIPYKWCITETDLRELVEDRRRERNTFSGNSTPAGAGQGMIGNPSGR